MILPLCPLMQLLDVIVAKRLKAWCDAFFDVPACCYMGCESGLQGADISHGVAQLLAKTSEFSTVAVGQADIKAYYDSLSPLLAARYVKVHGKFEDMVVAVALVRHQLLPTVELEQSGVCCRLRRRSTGTLTGSRVAGMIGRLVVSG